MFVRRGGGGRFTDRRCRGRRPRRPAEQSRPLPTMQKINGRQWQGCGPGMPGPYGLPQMGYGREGQGRAAVRPFAVGGWLPGNGRPRKARQSPSGLASSASSPDGKPFCAGEARERSLPIRGGGREAGRKGSGGWRGLPFTGGDTRPVGTPQASQARPAPLMGSLLRGRSPREKPPLSKGGAERKRGGGIPGRLRG